MNSDRGFREREKILKNPSRRSGKGGILRRFCGIIYKKGLAIGADL